MTVTIKGIDELKQKLKDIGERAEELEGSRSVPVTDLLAPEFMRAHTRFKDAQGLFDASGFKIENAADFKAIPDADWDAFIQSVSDFSDWRSMLEAAVKEWTRQRLGL
jgi:predicted transcriptional regulator